MMFFITIICVSMLFCLLIYVKFKRNTNEPPHVLGRLPIIGHLHRFLLNDLYGLLKGLSRECYNNGGVSTIDLGIRKLCVVTDPEDCLTVANTCLEKEKGYRLGRSLFGQGLLVSDVPTWKKHRKLLNPAFSQQVLNSFVETFNSQAIKLVQIFGDELGRPINHEHMLRVNNLETICLTSTGLNRKEHGDIETQYVALLGEALSLFTKKLQHFWLQSDFIFNMTPLKKKEDEIVNTLKKLSIEIIKIKRAKMENKKHNSTQNYSGRMKPFMDLILDLADETGCFTDEEIREETDNIIIAGHDTTATILTFVFTLLGSYPDIQDKVHKEIQEVFGTTNKGIEKGDISKLIYTEAVLKETLRLYPIGPVNGRYSDKPVKLKNYTIEANTGYLLLLYAVHRDPMWGPDAEVFRPERWLDTATLPDLNYFGGFALGKRNCIGKVYAMMFMKIVIAHVVRRYQISADVTKMELAWDILTKPRGSGHHITLQLRE